MLKQTLFGAAALGLALVAPLTLGSTAANAGGVSIEIGNRWDRGHHYDRRHYDRRGYHGRYSHHDHDRRHAYRDYHNHRYDRGYGYWGHRYYRNWW
ncbi:hypothetical protein A7A08_02023 [Methyloligella halotolerans]|uniref:Uncharacterized protein n=1 Tax=Methyloligella halotolerans TaxID=1177755 RepID=A0A1E2RYG1_9HYPH|nr:hypothetical protein [Methyloligella halotolerans]ODA67276.1 hypothetical protein A7A08_02023 [Methyloligella halotolerans]